MHQYVNMRRNIIIEMIKEKKEIPEIDLYWDELVRINLSHALAESLIKEYLK